MTDTTSNPGGESSNPSGIPEKVDFETYQKSLTQEKNAKERAKNAEEELKKLKDEKKSFEETKLKEQGEWQKIALQREQELKEAVESRTALEKNLIDSRKLSAVLDHLGGKIKRSEYYSFIDVDKISFNPETRQVDESMVKSVAQEFVKNHPELIEFKTGKLPQDAPGGGTTSDADQLKNCKTQLELDNYFAKRDIK